jgi:hypothetical protein
MKPEERAKDILDRCWWRLEEHPGEEKPPFKGLDVEIAAAIREAVIEEHNRVVLLMQEQMEDAVATEREACAKLAASYDNGTDDLRRGSDGGNITDAIRARSGNAQSRPVA